MRISWSRTVCSLQVTAAIVAFSSVGCKQRQSSELRDINENASSNGLAADDTYLAWVDPLFGLIARGKCQAGQKPTPSTCTGELHVMEQAAFATPMQAMLQSDPELMDKVKQDQLDAAAWSAAIAYTFATDADNTNPVTRVVLVGEAIGNTLVQLAKASLPPDAKLVKDQVDYAQAMLSNQGPVYENQRKLDDSADAIGRVAMQVLRQDAEQNPQADLREAVKQMGTFRCEAKCFVFVDPAEAPRLTADSMTKAVFPPDGMKDQRLAFYVDFSQFMPSISPMRVTAKGYGNASQQAVAKMQGLCNDASLKKLVAAAQTATNPVQTPIGNGNTVRLGYEYGSNATNDYGTDRIRTFSGGFQLVTPTDSMCVDEDTNPKSDIAVAAGITAG